MQAFIALLLKDRYGLLNAEQRESLMTIQNNAVRLADFVDNLLTTAKLEAKRMDVFCERFDLGPVLKEVHGFYRPTALEKNLEFRLIEPVAPLFVWADK